MSRSSLTGISDRIIRAALAAADPRAAVRQSLSQIDLPAGLSVVAVGKAAGPMASAALETLGPRVRECLAVMPHGYPEEIGTGDTSASLPRVTVFHAGHPVPDEAGLEAARGVVALVDEMQEADRCLLLLSGGGSSLLPAPLPGISLGEKIKTTDLLLRSGADIVEINTVRRHLSVAKGGRLAERCRGAILTLAVSDVVGDLPEAIASGPTVADPSTFADALSVLARYGLLDRVPLPVREALDAGRAGKIPETPKELPERFAFRIIASNRNAVDAAAGEARRCGFAPLVLTTPLSGEAREAGRMMAGVVMEVLEKRSPVRAPACIIAGGETTVTVSGHGLGGRNQEIALSAAIHLRGCAGIQLTSFATDGVDGISGAAGGCISGDTVPRGMSAGLDPQDCLSRNDSFAFLSAAGALVSIGPTGTNVNDLTFALIQKGARHGRADRSAVRNR